MPRKHGPNRLGNYITVHERWMAGLLDEGFVVEDQCAFTIQKSVVLLSGTIVCIDAVTIEVEKELAVLDGRGQNARVQTRNFRYHARLRGAHNILRYESAHEHRPHPHKHTYNTFGDGSELEVVELADEDAIPTLGEVVREVQDWHAANAGRLAT